MHPLRFAAAGVAALAVGWVLLIGLGHHGTVDAPAASRLDPATACEFARGPTRAVTVEVGGQGTRTALVRLPARNGPLPLVIALHGAESSGAFMERYSGFSRLADAEGFAVAYPNARGTRWTLRPGHGPDDVAFISTLLDRLLAGGCIDASRVSVAGVSNGGGLAALLGCEISGRLAAIASVAGSYRELTDCRPDHALSVLEIHGTADHVVPYHRGVLRWLRAWAARDGCARRPVRRAVAARVTRHLWTGCRDGTTVEHLAIAGGEHAWPGADPPDPGPRVALSASDQAWRFFAGRHRRR